MTICKSKSDCAECALVQERQLRKKEPIAAKNGHVKPKNESAKTMKVPKRRSKKSSIPADKIEQPTLDPPTELRDDSSGAVQASMPTREEVSMKQANEILPIDSQQELGWHDAQKTSKSSFLRERTVNFYGVEETTTEEGVKSANYDIFEVKLLICDAQDNGKQVKIRFCNGIGHRLPAIATSVSIQDQGTESPTSVRN